MREESVPKEYCPSLQSRLLSRNCQLSSPTDGAQKPSAQIRLAPRPPSTSGRARWAGCRTGGISARTRAARALETGPDV